MGTFISDNTPAEFDEREFAHLEASVAERLLRMTNSPRRSGRAEPGRLQDDITDRSGPEAPA